MDLLDKYMHTFNSCNNESKSIIDLYEYLEERNLNYNLTRKEKIVDHELYDNTDEALAVLSDEDIVILVDNKFTPVNDCLEWFDVEETKKHIEVNDWHNFCLQMSNLVIILAYEDMIGFSKSFDRLKSIAKYIE